jgi:protein gp37
VGAKTKIEWADATWNFVAGCDPVSTGCDRCYAAAIAHRFAGTPAYPNGFAVTQHLDRLDLPLKWIKPRLIFVNSTSDLFHELVPDSVLLQAWEIMARTPRHMYLILTKRPARMRSFVRRLAFATPTTAQRRAGISGRVPYLLPSAEANRRLGAVEPLANVWLGVSAEDQAWAANRIPILLETPAAERFLSAEPLVGAIDLTNLPMRRGSSMLDALRGDVKSSSDGVVYAAAPSSLDWVIAGGESGPDSRPMHPEWARSLRDQCTKAGTPFLFKQWGNWAPPTEAAGHSAKDLVTDKDRCQLVDLDGQLRGRPHDGGEAVDGLEPMRRYHKTAGGRVLDGSEWDEFPASTGRG